MKEEHIWTKKPETMLDWFCVVGACIALYLTLNNLGYFLGKIGVFIGIVSPFAGGIVIAYVLDPMVKFFYTKLFKEKKKDARIRDPSGVSGGNSTAFAAGMAGHPADRGQHRHAVYELPKLHTQRTGYAGHGSGALRR